MQRRHVSTHAVRRPRATASSRAARPSPVPLPRRSLSPAADRRGDRAGLGQHRRRRAISASRSRLSFAVNEIGMALFFALIDAGDRRGGRCPAARCTPGGAGALPLVAAAGGIVGSRRRSISRTSTASYETVLRAGWPIACAIDVAAAYYVLKTICRAAARCRSRCCSRSPPTRSASSSSRRVIPCSPRTSAARRCS